MHIKVVIRRVPSPVTLFPRLHVLDITQIDDSGEGEGEGEGESSLR